MEGRQFDENLYVFHGKSDYMVAVGKELWDEIRPSIVEDGGYFSPQVAQPTYEYALPDRSAGDSTSYFPQARNASAQRSQYYGENYAGTGSTGHGLDPTLKQMGGRDSTLKRTGGYDTEGAYDETSPRYTLSSNMPTISPQSPRAASSAADHTNPVNAPSTPAFYQDVPQWTYQQ